MSDHQPSAGAPADALQFDTAVTAAPAAGMTCAVCQRPIETVYHSAGGKTVCSACRAALENPPKGSFFRAALFGSGAGLAAAVVGGTILMVTGFFIVAAIVGYIVGRAVLRGSGSIGGRRYQVLALFLTYLASCGTFIGAIAREASGGAAAWIGAVIVSPMIPFFMIKESPFSVLIIGLSLWEAWRVTARAEIIFTGPHQVAQTFTATDTPAEPALA